ERVDAGHVVIDELIHVAAVGDTHANLEQEARAPLRIDPRIAAETEPGARVLVRHNVGVGLFSVIPPENALVHLTIAGQRHAPVALAGGCSLEFGNALL